MIIMESELATVDSEREEGEIVDELDDLSDISSEEEYLLRQRLQVLENYNNVLERKEAKKTTISGSGKYAKRDEMTKGHVLKQITHKSHGNIIIEKSWKDKQKTTSNKHKKIKGEHGKIKEIKRKKPHKLKKKIETTIDSESSDDAEYKNKRRKLANAVSITKKHKTDTSLKERLMNMLGIPHSANIDKIYDTTDIVTNNIDEIDCSGKTSIVISEINQSNLCTSTEPQMEMNEEGVDSHVDEDEDATQTYTLDRKDIKNIKQTDQNTTIPYLGQKEGSDEDLEILRQHALKSKPKTLTDNVNKIEQEETNLLISDNEDEDSDTTELRLICLRSALLKKAIEMKQKQKLQKRLSQSQSTLYDDVLSSEHEIENEKDNIDNNTDIESVDMDIGSDHDEPVNDPVHDSGIDISKGYKEETENQPIQPQDDFDEDEDILRTKLLTSLSKNLQNILPPKKNIEIIQKPTKPDLKDTLVPPAQVKEKTRFIINTADSDSEGENEATKNLTKMHMKLSEHNDFQQKLDKFLKSKRLEVEKSEETNSLRKQSQILPQESPSKFVPKAVNHLPNSEQQEYRELVKRMAELEKIKQARQAIMVEKPKLKGIVKVPAKPKIMPVNNQIIHNIDEHISLSRKKIAEESAKVLKLKEEGNKLSQKYKIVATELRNLGTALSLNKREYKSAQIRLSKIRNQHQILLNRSVIQSNKTKRDFKITHVHAKDTVNTKENLLKDTKNSLKTKMILKTIVNDIKDTQVTDHNNPKNLDTTNELKAAVSTTKIEDESTLSLESKRGINRNDTDKVTNSDYKSPLDAFCTSSWDGDPNGVWCPFEIGGSCKDDKCKYVHTNTHLS